MEQIKKLGVCGSSWACADSRHPQTHFTELLAQHYHCEYKNYALPGCANDVICLQIQQALEESCDCIIIQIEMPNRMTVSYPGKSDNDFRLKSVKSQFDYIQHPFASSNEKKSFISANHRSFLEQQSLLSKNQQENQQYHQAIEKYIKFLYSEKQQTVIDSWAFSHFMQIIIAKAIPFLFIIDEKNPIQNKMTHLLKHKLNSNKPFSYKKIAVLDNPVYHTDSITQKETFKLVLNHLDKY